jgi:hypothetical protein
MSLLGSMMRNKTSTVHAHTKPNERRPPEAGLTDPTTPNASDRMEYQTPHPFSQSGGEYRTDGAPFADVPFHGTDMDVDLPDSSLRTPQAAAHPWNHREDYDGTAGEEAGGSPFSPSAALFNESTGRKTANLVTPAPRETGATNASPSSLADEWLDATQHANAELSDENLGWEIVQEEFSQNMQRCGDITTSFDDEMLVASLLLETAHSDLLGWEASLLDQLDAMEEAEGDVDEMLHSLESETLESL